MKDNYLFLKEVNLDKLYNYTQKIECLYSERRYQSVPIECRKALEAIIKDFCRFYGIGIEQKEKLHDTAKKVKKHLKNEKFWNSFYAIKDKGNNFSHDSDNAISEMSKEETIEHLKIFYNFVCDYYEIVYDKKINDTYKIPIQMATAEQMKKIFQKVIYDKNLEIQKLNEQVSRLSASSKKAPERLPVERILIPKSTFYSDSSTNKSSAVEKYIKEAQANFANKNYKVAVNAWSKILKLDPDCKINYFDLATAERKLNKFDDAIEHYSIFIKKNSKSINKNNAASLLLANAYNKRGWCYEQQGKLNDAQSDYETAHVINPKIKNHTRLENKYKKQEQYETASLSNELFIDSEYRNINELLNQIEIKQMYNDLEKHPYELSLIEYDKQANDYYNNEEYQEAIEEWYKILEADADYKINYLRLAYAEYELGEYNDALEHYSKFIGITSNPEALAFTYNCRGWLYEQLGRYDEALKDYKNVLRLASDNKNILNSLERLKQKIEAFNENESSNKVKIASDYNNMGNECYNDKNYSEAIQNYTKAIEVDGKEPLYYCNRADAYYRNEKYQEAVNDWNKVLDLAPEYDVDYFNLAYSEVKIRDDDNALEHYNIYIKNNNESDSAYNNRGNIWKRKGEYKKAIKEYNKAIELNSKEHLYYDNRADAYYRNEKYQEAVNDWNKVLDLAPEYDVDYYVLAFAEFMISEYDKALDYLNIYVKNNPNSEHSYYLRGVIWIIKKEYKKAIEDYNKAIELNSKHPLYYDNRADAYYNNEKYQEAVNDWNKVLDLDPEYDVDYYSLAVAEYKIGDDDNAFKHYNICIDNDPKCADAYLCRGNVWDRKKEYKNAIEDYNKAIELYDKDPLYFCNRANTYYRNKNYQEAVNDWNKVLDLDPEYDINYFRLAYSEDEIGDYDKALEHYNIYIKNHSESAMAYNNRGYIYETLKEYRAAKSDYEMALSIEPEHELALNNLKRLKELL